MSNHFSDTGALARFLAEKMAKVDLHRGDHLFVGLNCFEPGQGQKVHSHAGEDKFYCLLEGRARMVVGSETREVGAGTVVWAPAGVPHGVEAALERTVMLVGMGGRPPASGHGG